MNVRRLPLLAYALALAIIVLDQVSKSWILGLQLEVGRPVPVLSFFNLTLVHNRGCSFGLCQLPAGQEAMRCILAAFSLAVSIGLIVWVRKAVKPLTAIAIGLIIGGALGNLVDRVRFGWVVDLLDFSGLHFPWVFNVADSGITIGVALLLAETLLTPDKPKASSQ